MDLVHGFFAYAVVFGLIITLIFFVLLMPNDEKENKNV